MNAQVVKLTILNDENDPISVGQYAQELQRAILNVAPPGAVVDRVQSDSREQNIGDTIVIEIVTVFMIKAVIEGWKAWQDLTGKGKKVQVQVDLNGKRFVVDETKVELAAAIVELEKLLELQSADKG